MATKADEKWAAIGDNPLVIISELRRIMEPWVEEIEDFIEDSDFVQALNTATRMIAGEVPEPSKSRWYALS